MGGAGTSVATSTIKNKIYILLKSKIAQYPKSQMEEIWLTLSNVADKWNKVSLNAGQ